MENEGKDNWKYKVNIARIADTDGPDSDLPKKLYYYCSLQTAMESILPQKRLLISPLIKTNDPRENKSFQFACISPPDHPLYNDTDWERKVSIILREDCKVLCFSADSETHSGFGYSRMWAYYGGNHKGVCLSIDTDKFIDENRDLIDIKLLRRVLYYEIIPNEPISHKWIDFGRANEIGDAKYLRDEFRKDHLQYLYFTKDKEWESERECRLIHFSEKQDNEYCYIENSLNEVFLGVDFHESYIPALKELTPKEMIKQLEYRHIKLVPFAIA